MKLASLSTWFCQVTDLDDEVGSPAEEFKAFAADTGMNRSQSEYCNVGVKTYLTNHPAKKFVFDFMRVLIIDNLCLTPASKQTPLVDLLLEVKTNIFTSVLHCFYNQNVNNQAHFMPKNTHFSNSSGLYRQKYITGYGDILVQMYYTIYPISLFLSFSFLQACPFITLIHPFPRTGTDKLLLGPYWKHFKLCRLHSLCHNCLSMPLELERAPDST